MNPKNPIIYNLDYYFTAVVTQVTSPDPANNNPNGTYSVELSSYVNATLAGSDPGCPEL